MLSSLKVYQMNKTMCTVTKKCNLCLYVHIHTCYRTCMHMCMHLYRSFMQIQSEMKQGVSSLQEQFTRGLRGNSANAKAQTLQAQDEVLSVTEYGRQECFRVRESLRRELEARMAVLEEVNSY